MQKKVLVTASTQSHILHFHLPYLQWFQQQGWQVHVAFGAETGPCPHTDRQTALPLQKRMWAMQNFAAALQLRRQIRRERYDLIVTHTALAAFFTRLAVMGLRTCPKVINMVHGYLFDRNTPACKRWLLTAAERLTAGRTDLLLTMNRWDHAFACAGKLGRKVVMVPGIGVDFSRFDRRDPSVRSHLRSSHGIAQDAFLLLYAAEFSGRKHHETILRALGQLPEQVVLALAGSGSRMEEMQQLAASLGVAHRVKFLGYVNYMADWYQTADAVVSSSRSEGLPFNIMEAMYMGLPVAASAVKGHEDLIVHGETGLLYAYDDDSALAEQVSRLLQEQGLAERLGRQGREAVLSYGLETVLPQVTALYASQFPQ